MQLRDAIIQVQEIGNTHGFTIVIVGGAITRLIGKKTTISAIDISEHTLTLKNAENPSVVRPEDKATLVDIDCIAFSNASDPFTKDVVGAFFALKKELQLLQQQDGFPAVSLEPVMYHPYFPKPNQLTQFVSSIESYHDHDFFFRLGAIKRDVTRSSLAFWTYILDDEQVISLSPLAIQLRYFIRGFSPKPKDMQKIFSEKAVFVQFVNEFNKKTKDALTKNYDEWHEFAKAIQAAKQPSMKIKKVLWNTYWATIGTYLAHGSGLVGKILLPLGNTFFAGK